MMRSSRSRRAKNFLSRTSVLELLEHRAMLAAYMFNDAANTLSVELGAGENITVSESSGTVSLVLSAGTFTQSGGDAAPGSGTNTLAITSANFAGSLSISNTTVADPGSNTVRFNGGGSLSLSTLTVTLTDPDADSDILFDGGFDVASTSSVSLTARRMVAVSPGSIISNSGSGGITMSGNRQATPQASNTAGIVIAGEVTTTGPGSISLSGRGGNGAFLMPGVFLFQNGQVKSTGSGDAAGEIIIDGIGGTNPGALVAGVYMDTGSLIRSLDGDIQITGVGGNVASSDAYGFYIPNTGIVESIGTGAGAAKIKIEGTSTQTSGINMQGTGNIRSVVGAIELIAEAPPTGPGIHFLSQTPIVTTGTAPVSLISNRINLDGGITAPLGVVSLTGKTSGRPIHVGSIGSTTELGLTDEGLDRVATRHLKIGDSSSGDVTVSQQIDRLYDMSVTSGTKIDVNASITLSALPEDDVASPADLTFDAPTINIAGSIFLSAISTVRFQGGTLNANGSSPGSFTTDGILSLASSATHHAQIAGPAPSHDHLIVQAGVSIDSATLDLDFGSFTPAIGDSFVLIDNRSTFPTAGAFKDLPEGAFLSADGMVFQISYAALPDFGANDVVITRVTPPATASLVVDNTGDAHDGNYGAGQLTLREAMLLANLLSDQTSITFDATVFAGAKTITLTGGELPTIVQPVNITGTGANRLTIDAAGQSRHLQIPSEAVIVSLSGMTFANGDPGNIADSTGGSILNEANLIISAMTFEQNVTIAGGGAIANSGSMIVNDSAFIGNEADSGGAINNTGTLRVFNSTLSGNSVEKFGGGVSNFGAGTSSFINCTIVDNFADTGQAGGIYGEQEIVLNNTIVAGNTSGGGGFFDLFGPTIGFNNLIGDAGTAGGLTDGDDGNIVGIDGIGTRPLATIVEVTPAFNGGPTKTHKLVANSVAIDAGRNDAAIDAADGPLQFDQRGTPFDRIVNDTVDIGAYELALPSIPGDGNVTASVKKGKLQINGDALGNAFRVTQVDGDSYRIEGIDQTTINGQAFFVAHGVVKDWNVNLGMGADTFLLGAADSPVNIREKLVIDCGKNSVGSDTLTFNRVTVMGKTTIKGNSLPLLASLVDSVFQSDFDLKSGISANDNVTIEGTRFRKKVSINLDGGDDLLTIRNTRCDSDASFALSSGTNDRADVGLPRTKTMSPNSNGNTFNKAPQFSGVEVFL